ncbi:MAG: ATP-binding protein [Candidatus Gracilibacteria bacterium]|nr:ATP-binding protein [Candidatus Gracilibacteria bacterium]MDD2908662.1 ATP-binding protein [Candidatus Gracilibacteria bacterium]
MITEILKEKIIARKFYNNGLKNYLNSNVIKVITGMRRVGKSYLMKYLIQDIINDDYTSINNIFYINKEDLEFDYIKDYTDLNNDFIIFLSKIDKNKKIIVCVDEIQEIKGWERFINSILSKYQTNIEIFITGSNSNMLSSELSTLITGRYIEFEVFPLSFKEYCVFADKEKSKDLFLEYLKYGGLPGIFYMNKDDRIIFNYLKGIYSTILLKDIVSYFGLRNIDFFENLYKYIFSNIGNIFSAKSISDYLKSQKVKISPETVLNYLDYGLKVYLLDLVKATNPDTKKYFEIYNKYYVGDLGLRNSLVGFDIKRDMGKLMENYVFLELKRYGYDIKIGRLSSGKEIDFIAEKNGIIKYFQVCYLLGSEDTINREYYSLEEIKDNWEKYVVSFDDIDFGISQGIKHINVMKINEVL